MTIIRGCLTRYLAKLGREEGRVDLVCNEQSTGTWIKSESMWRSAGMLWRAAEISGPTAPKREVKTVVDNEVVLP